MKITENPVDWTGSSSPFLKPISRAYAPFAPGICKITHLLSPDGSSIAKENTIVEIQRNNSSLLFHIICETKEIERIKELMARKSAYGRDEWGKDAIELQINPEPSQEIYKHIIIQPNSIVTTFFGTNNRTMHGWHPVIMCNVRLKQGAWIIDLKIPFSALGKKPSCRSIWTMNIMRTNPSEKKGYVQWSPTFGDALRPELFGSLYFNEIKVDRQEELSAYFQHALQRKIFFLTKINNINEDNALSELGLNNWQEWNKYLTKEKKTISLRWEDFIPGKRGIPECDRKMIIKMANSFALQIKTWSVDNPPPESLGIERVENLADAYLLTGNRYYVTAFEKALLAHNKLIKQITSTITNPYELYYKSNPYHDSQIIRAEMIAHAYLTMKNAGLSDGTHATVMWTILRSCRFADFNIRTAYNYGNHQVYESSGLAAVAALFPEFPESSTWAKTASSSLKYHLMNELYPDGGYMERCGYHSVAMGYLMHAVATIIANNVEKRFPTLMNNKILQLIEKMHEWDLKMLSPVGTMPDFGDCGLSSHLRFLARGAAIFKRKDFAWPVSLFSPCLLPPKTVKAKKPEFLSESLPSYFTIMRDGWEEESLYMAIDHGPLGGQHSHIDTCSFIAYAYGIPIAMDSGIGTSYEDPKYIPVFRSLRAHNVIAIDNIETEKIAERLLWEKSEEIEHIKMLSHAYKHSLNVLHYRDIFFIKRYGWIIHDLLEGPSSLDFSRHQVDWLLHTPFALKKQNNNELNGEIKNHGLSLISVDQQQLQNVIIDDKPASYPPVFIRHMRLWDAAILHGKEMTRQIKEITIRTTNRGNRCKFIFALLPYYGKKPAFSLSQTNNTISLKIDNKNFYVTI